MSMYPEPQAQVSQEQISMLQAQSATTTAAVVTVNLTRVFEQKVAVNNLNLQVRRGEFFGFLGPNGAGKSTTIKMLVGQLRPTAGAAWVGGIDVCKDPLAARSLMGVLPEYLNLRAPDGPRVSDLCRSYVWPL